jgi:hypothetical protein
MQLLRSLAMLQSLLPQQRAGRVLRLVLQAQLLALLLVHPQVHLHQHLLLQQVLPLLVPVLLPLEQHQASAAVHLAMLQHPLGLLLLLLLLQPLCPLQGPLLQLLHLPGWKSQVAEEA